MVRRSVILILFAWIIAGCASNPHKGVDVDKYRQIRDGVTTKSEVYRMFGQPTDVVNTKDGKILVVYEVTKMNKSAIGYVPCLNLLYNPVTFNFQTLAFLIGYDGKVEKHTLRENKHKSRADIFGTPWQ